MARKGEPDPIWDVICELFHLTPQTKQERTRIGRVVSSLKQKGANEDDIRKVYQRCCCEWRDISFSPEALFKWFDQFKVKPAPKDRPTGRVRS